MRVVSFAFLCVLLVSCADRSTTTGDVEPTAQQSFQWKLVTTWPKNFPGLGTAPENFAKNVERMSNGQIGRASCRERV